MYFCDAAAGISRLYTSGEGAARDTSSTRENISEREGMGNGSGGMPGEARYMASREEAQGMDILDERNLARYDDEIDKALKGKLPSGAVILVGKTPEILMRYGAVDGPLYMNQRVARKAAYEETQSGGKHALGEGILRVLPEDLVDPIAITKNTTYHQREPGNSFIVWTQWVTDDGNPVVVPIRLGVEMWNGQKANVIKSIYDVHNPDYMKDLTQPESILYTKNKESINQLLSQGRKLPEARADDASSNSISDSAGNSNTEIEGVQSRFDNLTAADRARTEAQRQAEEERARAEQEAETRYSVVDEDIAEIGETEQEAAREATRAAGDRTENRAEHVSLSPAAYSVKQVSRRTGRCRSPGRRWPRRPAGRAG